MNFERPYFLILIPILILLIYFYYKKGFYKLKLELNLGTQISNTKYSFLYYLQFYFPFLKFISIFLLILAISGPSNKIEFLPDETKGVDILIALDVSGSMVQGRDLSPNRLIAAKRIIESFISKRKLDRIGIAAFSGAAYLQAPISSDKDSLIEILKDIDGTIIDEQGTAIGDAVVLATQRLKNSKAKSKLMILLTDGASNAGKIDPKTASEIANTFEIKIYSIGIGKDTQFETDFAILNEISNNTKGKFFRATDEDELETIFSEIDSLERDVLDAKPKNFIQSHYLNFLIPAILILILDFLIRARFFRYYL